MSSTANPHGPSPPLEPLPLSVEETIKLLRAETGISDQRARMMLSVTGGRLALAIEWQVRVKHASPAQAHRLAQHYLEQARRRRKT